MTSLEERVARAIADAFPSAGRGSSALRTQPIDLEAATDLARAAIAVCAEEMANKVDRYQSFPQPTSRAAQYHELHVVKPAIAAAIRCMGERQPVDGVNSGER